MITDEIQYNNEKIRIPDDFPISPSAIIKQILELQVQAVSKFIAEIKDDDNIINCAENRLTQTFVEQIQACRKAHHIFNVQTQYNSRNPNEKGHPDYYFFIESTFKEDPIFVVEAKKLTTKVPKKRKMEYVKGHNHNGGIERFKHGQHGVRAKHSGMLAFVMEGCFSEWTEIVNVWIDELSEENNDWLQDEKLDTTSIAEYHQILESQILVLPSKDRMKLTHLWVLTQKYNKTELNSILPCGYE